METTKALNATLPNLSESNDAAPQTESLSPAQKLLLCWHYRLSHLSFAKIQELARQGHLPKKLATCEPPLCSSCQYDKAHKRPATNSNKARPIDQDDLKPGDRVSVDQLESPMPGMVNTYSGKLTTACYHIIIQTVEQRLF
jgi:hypothetical protein